MGKIKKLKVSKMVSKESLGNQIERDQLPKPTIRLKGQREETKDAQYVDDRLSYKILQKARKQQQELEESFEISAKHKTSIKFGNNSDSDKSDSEPENDQQFEYCNTVEIKKEDEETLEKFMNPNAAPRRTLGDIIFEKINEKKTEIRTELSDNASLQIEDMDPRIKQMYEGVRNVLIKYRSGKLPKAFKMIPALRSWEEILYITDPSKWTAAAMYQGTRIFTSNLKENMAQRFFNQVLLPRIRDDVYEHKKLNIHLYQAIRKALFKPGAFMKGFLLPLCESGNCTLREAIIISSVLARNSIPVLHSSAAILKIAEMDYNGANSIFLRTLFDKKYALPYRVIDACVYHFLRFERDKRELPVLWHQSLLTFCQRYKSDISSEQREALLNLLKSQKNPVITPEIRRELQSAQCRDLEMIEPESNQGVNL